jgi:hypothetical protein
MMKYMSQIQCTNCKGYKTQIQPSYTNPISLLGFLGSTLGCGGSLIALFFWPLFIITLPVMLISMVVIQLGTYSSNNKTYACKSCGKKIYIKTNKSPEEAKDLSK